MKILLVNGSCRTQSSNSQLLDYLEKLGKADKFYRAEVLHQLPLYNPELDLSQVPEIVTMWRNLVVDSDGVIITTPEYLHNIPASLKNSLEWLKTSGELNHKPVLAITYTPHTPRGKKAMQSLVWTLQALNARILATLPLYHSDISFHENGSVRKNSASEVLMEAIQLFK